MNTPKSRKNQRRDQSWSSWVWRAVLHIGASLLVALALAWALLPAEALKFLALRQLQRPELLDMSSTAILLHLGLSASLWALVVIAYHIWRRPKPRMVHRLSRAGTVLTETLIILPVFLLLSFGMAQLAINNIGGILANVAVYEAARAAWIWQPEVDVERVNQTISAEDAQNRTRVAAALVMTPVAPGGFFNTMEGDEVLKKNRLAMAASQVPMAGALGLEQLLAVAGLPPLQAGTPENLSFTAALDTSSFLRRSLLKFSHAYQATDVTITDADGRIGADLEFKLHQTMPLVGPIFGEQDTVESRSGYFSTFSRSYSFRAQPYKPNAALPDDSFGGEKAEDDRSFDDINFDDYPDP